MGYERTTHVSELASDRTANRIVCRIVPYRPIVLSLIYRPKINRPNALNKCAYK
jgi:hypothetical protein